jgi:S-DNA-T family DNA segregation ATPase FtsK/SpoIIIE
MATSGTARRASTRAKRGAARPAKPVTRRAVQRASEPAPAPPKGHRRELGAIACVALAVFLGFVLYLGWDGGTAGRWLSGALLWLVGLIAYASPLILAYVAYTLAAGEERRPRRSLTVGIALLVTGFLLAAAADTFGLFGGSRPQGLFADAYMEDHGGALGEGLWAILDPFVGGIGVDVLVVALWAGGLLLVTGSSLGLWAQRSKAGVAQAGRAAKAQAASLGERRRETATRMFDADEDQTVVIDAHDAATVVARVPEYAPFEPAQAPAGPRLIDGAHDAPEIFGAASATSYPAAAQPAPPEPVDDADEGEQLNLAEAVKDDPDAHETALAFTGPEVPERRVWEAPDPRLLQRMETGRGETPQTISSVSQRLVETLGHFNIPASVVGTVSGPRVTRYELQLAPGIKVSRVAGLKDDLAYALAATDIRVQAPIPGKQAVGVEVPNVEANYVSLGDVYQTFPPHASPLAFWLGKDVSGKPIVADLVKMVHLLIAGTTGSGKSGCINALISSILLRATPDQVRMIMIDPKKVELSNFDGIPHLLAPVVTNMKQASYVLDNICREMDRRYEIMARHGSSQNIRDLNKKLEKLGEEPLPYIMVIVDELADLMMVAPSEVEDSVIRLGQLGRGAGVHLVVATQRPSVDVVTGMIKTNVPSRIAFAVSSQTDSRVILDQGGAESLLGSGDMLFHPLGSTRTMRVQGAFVTPREMKLITEHWRRQAAPEFREDLLENPAGADTEAAGQATGEDEYLADAIRTVSSIGAASVAQLQRRLRVGYARAGRLIDIMEQMGIVSGFEGSKARTVLMDDEEIGRVLAQLEGRVPADDEIDDPVEDALGAGEPDDLLFLDDDA